MKNKIEKFINGLKLRPGMSRTEIVKIQSILQLELPGEYKDFLLESNGTEGFVGKSYLVLWPLDEIEKLNKLYAVDEFAPGLLLFGSDGGDMAYGFDARSPSLPIIEIPFIGMGLNEIRVCSPTFYGFLEYLFDKK